MPRGNGTGPMGMGPMTGRGAGFCAGYGTPGYMNPMPGCGFCMGFGGGRGGRGNRRMFYATGLPGWARYNYPAYGGAYDPAVDEKEVLSGQAEILEEQLQQIKKRISDLDNSAE